MRLKRKDIHRKDSRVKKLLRKFLCTFKILLCMVVIVFTGSSTCNATLIVQGKMLYSGKVYQAGTKNANTKEPSTTSADESKQNTNIQESTVAGVSIDSEETEQTSGAEETQHADPVTQTHEKPEIIYPIYWGDTTKPEIALTFDDGYNYPSIVQILDALRQRNIKCTFFIIGQHLRDYPDLWRQAVADGHQICNHTLNHKLLGTLDEAEIRNQILGWEQAVIDVLGQDYLNKMKSEFPLIRFPGGSGFDMESVLKISTEYGYIPIGWSVETYNSVLMHHNLNAEPAEPIANEVMAHVLGNTSNGSIVLLHFVTHDAMKINEILDGLIGKGFELKYVTDIINY